MEFQKHIEKVYLSPKSHPKNDQYYMPTKNNKNN